MPFRAESSSFRAYSAQKPFSFHVCTMNADGSGNKRLTEKSEEKYKTAYRWKLNHIRFYFYMLFPLLKKDIF